MTPDQRLHLHILLESSQTVVLRPVGWKATSDEGRAFLRSQRQPGYVFRGMTDTEFQATVKQDGMVRSNRMYSLHSEGTSFSADPEDAESYVNFGRDDPRTTGKPTWLVQVHQSKGMYKDSDGYVKSREPIPAFSIWKMWAEDGAILIKEVSYHPQLESRRALIESAQSLWLHPQRGLQIDLLGRFKHYPHFVETLDQFSGLHIPKSVLVQWLPFHAFPAKIITDSEEEAEQEADFIDEIQGKIEGGADVPPLIINAGKAFDGRHRAIAARQAGIRLAPVVDISSFWR